MGGNNTDPWQLIHSRLPAVVDSLERVNSALLTIEVDGEVAGRLVRPSRAQLEAHASWRGMGSLTPVDWLAQRLGRLARLYPAEHSIALYAGQQPVVVVRRPTGDGR